MTMYIEFVAIITTRTMYLVFRPHRFVISFGYGFDADDDAMTGVPLLITSMFLEMVFEAVVDAFALSIEWKHGIALNKFWAMWKENPVAFWGATIFQGFAATVATCWAFKLMPNAMFCTSPTDPCSCSAGGFEIYARFCNKTDENLTSTPSIEQAAREYKGIFESLAGDSVTVLVSVGVVVLMVAVFVFFRKELEVKEANRNVNSLNFEKAKLLEQNKRIQDQLALRELTQEQTVIVHAGAEALETAVPARFKIDSKTITFEALLGSGSFGDCYKGHLHNVAVAVKQMRVVSHTYVLIAEFVNYSQPIYLKYRHYSLLPHPSHLAGPDQRRGLPGLCQGSDHPRGHRTQEHRHLHGVQPQANAPDCHGIR